MFPQQASQRLCVGGGACPEPVERVSRRPAHQLRIIDLRPLSQRKRTSASRHAVALCEGGFTLLELLIVVGIIVVLMVLLALLDILLIRTQARAARKVLQQQFSERNTPSSMGSQDQN